VASPRPHTQVDESCLPSSIPFAQTWSLNHCLWGPCAVPWRRIGRICLKMQTALLKARASDCCHCCRESGVWVTGFSSPLFPFSRLCVAVMMRWKC
jgi:hypothetical protein